MLSNLIYFWIDSMAPQMADIRRKKNVSRDNYLSQKTIICLKRQLFVSKDNYLSQKTISRGCRGPSCVAMDCRSHGQDFTRRSTFFEERVSLRIFDLNNDYGQPQAVISSRVRHEDFVQVVKKSCL